MTIADILQNSSTAQLDALIPDASGEHPKQQHICLESISDLFPDTINPDHLQYIAAKDGTKVLARRDAADRLALIFPASGFLDSRVNEWRAIPAGLLEEQSTEEIVAYIAHKREYNETKTIIATVSRENDEILKQFIKNPEIFIDLYKDSGAIIYKGTNLIGFAFE